MEKTYEHEYVQLSNVKEEGSTLDGFSEDCSQLVKSYVSDGFKEKFILLIYNEKEEQSCHHSQYVIEPTVCNKQRDYKEEDENSQWDVSLNLSNSETFCQEDNFLLNLVEQNDIPLEVLEKKGVVDVEILNEVADISLKNNHENSFQSYSEDWFDNMQEELLFGQPCHDKHVIEYFEICHAFYDPVAEHMDKFFRWGS